MKKNARALKLGLATLVGFGAVVLSATPAQAADSTIAAGAATVAAGSDLTLNLTPGTNGLTDFCNRNTLLAGSNNAAGFSLAGWASNDGGSNGVLIPVDLVGPDNYEGAGFGSFNPTTQTAPFDITFVVPQDAPAGDYIIYFGCVGPSPEFVAWNVPFGFPSLTTTVSVTAYVPPAPAPGPDPTAANSNPLPATGQSLSLIALTGLGATIALFAGFVALRMRLARIRNQG